MVNCLIWRLKLTDVLVGMSGGIDSSVAAYLLKEQGFNVHGVTMTVWKQDGKYKGDPSKNSCFSPDKSAEIEKTREICDKIGMDYTVLDISDLYESIVLQNFRNEYLNGRTPNPCVWCNSKIKFGAMVDFAREKGIKFDMFATGHYARIVKQDGRWCLYRGKDPVKDQSYFLYRLTQKQLSNTIFPLGGMTKEEVRKIDFELGFHPCEQTESQDFYSGHYTDLLDTQPKEGNIVDQTGKILGKHNGMWNYTIGQRKGLGIAASQPLYVTDLDPVNNLVVVGYEDSTYNKSVVADRVNWVATEDLSKPIHAKAKIRSMGEIAECTVSCDYEGRLKAVFDKPVKAATCGQSLVIYEDDKVLCGGIISGVE